MSSKIRTLFATSVAGAAMLAGLATGVFRTPAGAARAFVKKDRIFEPDAQRHTIYREKWALYQQIFPATQELLKTDSPQKNAKSSKNILI